MAEPQMDPKFVYESLEILESSVSGSPHVWIGPPKPAAEQGGDPEIGSYVIQSVDGEWVLPSGRRQIG